ncbi:MAG: hypothetical protein QOF89_5664 [Acidobacteriota bacterium]|nr:hypothetical protein [Acidobacteriota bacterium]
MSDSLDGRAAAFDVQAGSFDRRAGLPPAAVDRIARTLREICPQGLLLELGAGTGEIGAALIAAGSRYAGLDVSLGMLGVFRGRSGRAPLFLADADRPWPVRDGCARAVFASRSAHRLAMDGLVAETLRAAHPDGAVFVLGRVRRERESLRAILRRQMRHLLAERGVEGRGGGEGGEEAGRSLLAAFEARGAVPLPDRTAASWTVQERAADSLASWRGKPGLAGTAVDPDLKREVLERLEAWARETFGTLDITREATEAYELAAVRLPVREEIA